jgi:hypothetical protein
MTHQKTVTIVFHFEHETKAELKNAINTFIGDVFNNFHSLIDCYEGLYDVIREPVNLDPSFNLKHSRRVLGLTQVELAKHLGTSQPIIARWEATNRIPDDRKNQIRDLFSRK